jgi:hypothetical protein
LRCVAEDMCCRFSLFGERICDFSSYFDKAASDMARLGLAAWKKVLGLDADTF